MEQELQKFLTDNNISETSTVNFALKSEEARVVRSWLDLVTPYETELSKVLSKNYKRFDIEELPETIQKAIGVVLTKSPGFSSISAASIVTFTLAELFGQLRPKINDNVYSPDLLGINYNSFVLERSGCVDMDTEFCTHTGWKRISDYQEGDLVLSWEEDGSSKFDKPVEFVKNKQGTLTHFKSRTIDMMLSDEHNITLQSKITKRFRKISSSEFKQEHLSNKKGSSWTLPFKFNTPDRQTGIDLTDDELRLFIAYVADGTVQNYSREKCSSNVRIRVKKEYKKERLRVLLKAVYGTVDERITESEPEYSRFYFNPVKGKREKTFKDLWNLSEHQMEVVSDEFWRWDGCKDTRNKDGKVSYIFRTTKKDEADLVQFVWACTSDCVVTISTSERHDKTPYHTEYTVRKTFRKSIGFRSKTPKKLLTTVKTVDGFEYCFTMPNGNWVMRRDDKIVLTYNSGKDSAYQAMQKTFAKAYGYIDEKKLEGQLDKAKKQYIFLEKQKDSEFDYSSVVPTDYQHMVKGPEQTNMSLKSTRGGISASLNRLEGVELGTKSLFSSELAMALSGASTIEIFELLSELYDMGCVSAAPEFKTEEVRESPIKDMYVNMLGISSPSMFLTSDSIKRDLIPLIKTALARRLFFINPNVKDNYENLVVPTTPAGVRELQANNRNKHRVLSEQVGEKIFKSVKNTLSNKTLIFDDDAGMLYSDYKAYTEYKAKIIATLMPGSIISIEMEGRAFKLGRVAALWALAEDSRIITKPILEATIYFAEHSAEHLARFDRLITMKAHDLLANDYLEGSIGNVLPIDQAIIKGYITTANAGAIKSFLEPLNSTLRGKATVSYSTTDNSFKFIPTVRNVSVGDYSYTVSPVLKESDRDTKPSRVRDSKTLNTIQTILSNDAIFTTFGSKETTKWLVLKVEKSNISPGVIDKYLEKYNRLISSDKSKDIISIVLPLNEEITKNEYTYVINSIATELMLKAKSSVDEIYHSYKNSEVLGKFDSGLEYYNVSQIRANYASKTPQPKLRYPQDLTKAQRTKSAIKALENVEQSVDHIDGSDNVLLTFAQVVRYMKVEHVTGDDLEDAIDSVNSLLSNRISESDKEKYLIEPFKEL